MHPLLWQQPAGDQQQAASRTAPLQGQLVHRRASLHLCSRPMHIIQAFGALFGVLRTRCSVKNSVRLRGTNTGEHLKTCVRVANCTCSRVPTLGHIHPVLPSPARPALHRSPTHLPPAAMRSAVLLLLLAVAGLAAAQTNTTFVVPKTASTLTVAASAVAAPAHGGESGPKELYVVPSR